MGRRLVAPSTIELAIRPPTVSYILARMQGLDRRRDRNRPMMNTIATMCRRQYISVKRGESFLS
jgi:hypothetical protein